MQPPSGSLADLRFGHSAVVCDPRHRRREVARREQRGALDDIPAGRVRAREPLHEGMELGVAPAASCALTRTPSPSRRDD